MSDGNDDITPKQEAFIEALRKLGSATAREAADEMQQSDHRSERVSDDEARGLAERTEVLGHVVQYTGDKGEARYRLAS